MNGEKPRRKPWFARSVVDWQHYTLGYFETREEAVEVEQAFRAYMREERELARSGAR